MNSILNSIICLKKQKKKKKEKRKKNANSKTRRASKHSLSLSLFPNSMATAATPPLFASSSSFSTNSISPNKHSLIVSSFSNHHYLLSVSAAATSAVNSAMPHNPPLPPKPFCFGGSLQWDSPNADSPQPNHLAHPPRSPIHGHNLTV